MDRGSSSRCSAKLPLDLGEEEFVSNFVSDIIYENCYADHIIATILSEDSESSHAEEEESPSTMNVQLCSDLSCQLGKHPCRKPKFARFAATTCSIQAAVHEMRMNALTKLASKKRSWVCGYSFTHRSSKKPVHSRFVEVPTDIQSAVQEMRQASLAKGRAKGRSWAAEFAFTNKSDKLPRASRFASPRCNIQVAVEEMRFALLQKSKMHRSWMNSFSFTNRTAMRPLGHRYAQPYVDIGSAVQQMRSELSFRRSTRHRSWMAAFSFTNKSMRRALSSRYAKPYIDIGTAVQQMRLELAEKRMLKQKETREIDSTTLTSSAQSSVQCDDTFAPSVINVPSILCDAMNIYMDDDDSMMMVDCDYDDVDSDAESESTVESESMLTNVHLTEKPTFVLGNDISAALGKSASKKPMFSRFAAPAADIKSAVEEMRLAAHMKRQSKVRSWCAIFSFTNKSSKLPAAARFATPSVDIQTATQEMRDSARAKRASKTRSWSASFALNGKSCRKPMPQLRLAAQKRRATKSRSWMAAFAFTNRVGTQPRFARFSKPYGDIQSAVEEMRRTASSARVGKNFTCDLFSKLLSKLDAEDDVPVENCCMEEGHFDMSDCSMDEIRQHLDVLLRGFKTAALKSKNLNAKQLPNLLRLREAQEQVLSTMPANDSAEPVEEFSLDHDAISDDLDADVLTRCEECSFMLRRFESHAEAYVKEQEVEQLIHEEQMRNWVAGSPAAAARSMRRSTPSLFQMDADDEVETRKRESSLTRGYEALGVPMFNLASDDRMAVSTPTKRQEVRRSAMSMDLDSSASYAPLNFFSAQRSARTSSLGAIKNTRSKLSLGTSRVLKVSKSSSTLTGFSRHCPGADANAWSVGPLSTCMQGGSMSRF